MNASRWRFTGDAQIGRLADHRLRVQLTHVSAGVAGLNVAQDQLPRLMNVVVDPLTSRCPRGRHRMIVSLLVMLFFLILLLLSY